MSRQSTEKVPIDSADNTRPPSASSSRDYESSKKPLEFWLVFLGLCVTVFLAALELTSVGTALPTIVADLHGSNFVWVGSAYALAQAALMPAFGGLSNIYGRRSMTLIAIFLFAVGSAMGGAAQSMNMLFAARAIQGMGGGGIVSLSEIVVADLVSLRERGKYAGMIGAVWALASVVGPPVGGALASAGQWRWLFYMNIPLSGLAAAIVIVYLKLKRPESSEGAMKRIDWIGNLLIVGSTAAIILALTWGGVQYPWTSYQVLVPLLVGLAGIGGFVAYEGWFPKEPVVPLRLLATRTSAVGYATTFLHGIITTMLTFYMPTYFQGAKGASAVVSGVELFGSAFIIAPFAIIAGRTIEITGKYKLLNNFGWAMGILGYGVLSILTAQSSIAMGVGLQIIGAIGLGVNYVSPNFAVLAPLAVEDNANALALMAYLRTFGQTFGITIGTTILQNGLKDKLPASFLAQFPEGAEISYALIPTINSLPADLKLMVQNAYADSISNLWLTICGIAGLGFLISFIMKDIPLRVTVDDTYGLEKKRQEDLEAQKAEEMAQTA